MLPAIYDVAAIRQRLAQLEEERRQKVDELANGPTCNYPACLCRLHGLPCKKKRATS